MTEGTKGSDVSSVESSTPQSTSVSSVTRQFIHPTEKLYVIAAASALWIMYC